MATNDIAFTGSIAQVYDTQLVPLIFEPYAADLVRRLPATGLTRLLEIAAGTGVVTRAMAAALPETISIVATDLNPAMLERAAAVGTSRPVQWKQADAMALPFDAATFDAVVCQFGVMFFPDKARAFAEVRRVLRPGGLFLFNVWDRLETNEHAETVMSALARAFSDAAPRFVARVPHGYFDRATIERDLARGGFTARPEFTTVATHSRGESARSVATAYCQGTPVRGELEASGAGTLEEATDVATAALVERFGNGPIEGRIQAHVVAIVG
jgi:ubiquinone/menaquinone biosynthesis C-methylase UbiE